MISAYVVACAVTLQCFVEIILRLVEQEFFIFLLVFRGSACWRDTRQRLHEVWINFQLLYDVMDSFLSFYAISHHVKWWRNYCNSEFARAYRYYSAADTTFRW